MEIRKNRKNCMTFFFRLSPVHLVAAAILLFLVSGCATTTRNIDMHNDKDRLLWALIIAIFKKQQVKP